MTTAAQIKKLAKPLLARHDDLALLSPWIFLKPVHHVVRGILIEKTGEAVRFRPNWAVMHFCEPMIAVELIWAARMPPPRGTIWSWDNSCIAEAFVEVVENEALPLLRPITTLDDFVAFANAERFPATSFDGYLIRNVIVDVARGDLQSARTVCIELQGPHRWKGHWLYNYLMTEFCPMILANDRSALARQLHRREAENAKKLKLESIWEPTPFPLELQTGQEQTS